MGGMQACQDAHSQVMTWSSGSDFVANTVLAFLLVSVTAPSTGIAAELAFASSTPLPNLCLLDYPCVSMPRASLPSAISSYIMILTSKGART